MDGEELLLEITKSMQHTQMDAGYTASLVECPTEPKKTRKIIEYDACQAASAT